MLDYDFKILQPSEFECFSRDLLQARANLLDMQEHFTTQTKVKNVKSSSCSLSVKSTKSLFYRFNQNRLVYSELQIRRLY